MTIDAGILIHVVEILENNKTRGSGGSTKDKWEVVDKRRAAIRPIRGRERVEGKRLESRVTHRITMRYWKGLTSENMLRFNGREFNLDSVINVDERNEELEIMAIEVI